MPMGFIHAYILGPICKQAKLGWDLAQPNLFHEHPYQQITILYLFEILVSPFVWTQMLDRCDLWSKVEQVALFFLTTWDSNTCIFTHTPMFQSAKLHRLGQTTGCLWGSITGCLSLWSRFEPIQLNWLEIIFSSIKFSLNKRPRGTKFPNANT